MFITTILLARNWSKLTTKTCHRAIKSHFPTWPLMLAASRMSLKCCASSGPDELSPSENHPTISFRFMFLLAYTEIINVTSLSWKSATCVQKKLLEISSKYVKFLCKPERWKFPWTTDLAGHVWLRFSIVQFPVPCCWRDTTLHMCRALFPAIGS